MWIVSRVASQNPDINGRTLYLTDFGMWSLDREWAHKFTNHDDAQAAARRDAQVEQAEEEQADAR